MMDAYQFMTMNTKQCRYIPNMEWQTNQIRDSRISVPVLTIEEAFDMYGYGCTHSDVYGDKYPVSFSCG